MRYTRGAVLIALVMSSHESAGAGPMPAPAFGVVDGINVGCAVDQSIYYNFNFPWYAIPYTPSFDYTLGRIEFLHGENNGIGSGTVRFQVRVDSLGAPARAALTSGQNALSPIVTWQGSDVPPIMVSQSLHYWIVLAPVLGSQASIGDAFFCPLIPWSISNDGVHWTPTARSVDSGWMVRFFDTTQSPIRGMTWAVVKTLYR
jgi:hypothetical protein